MVHVVLELRLLVALLVQDVVSALGQLAVLEL